MATPDEQWWEAQAGEYVLGTLRGAERDVFKKILAADDQVREKVRWWQEKLGSLDSLTEPVEPPEHVLPAIMKRIRAQHGSTNARQQNEPGNQGDAVQTPQPQPTGNIAAHRPRRRTSRRSNAFLWKSVATIATAASVAMAAFLMHALNRPAVPVNPVIDTVTILQSEEREALWVLTTDTNRELLHAVALAPPPIEADRSYQLWMVEPDHSAVNSVGLLPQSEGESISLALPISTDSTELFAVSLEPAGGSPEAEPTGPVLFTGTITHLANEGF